MPLSEKVNVTTGGIHGRCWFAKEDIAEGELVWWIHEDPNSPLSQQWFYPVDEVMSWPDERRNNFLALAYQVDDDTFSGFPEDLSTVPGLYILFLLINNISYIFRKSCARYSPIFRMGIT
jgi:hypothetical protein